jgi:hypothetical protein
MEGGAEGEAEAEAAIIIVDENGSLGFPSRRVEMLGGDDDVPRGNELGAEVALHLVLVDADVGGMDS